jgi:hypothetical protein
MDPKNSAVIGRTTETERLAVGQAAQAVGLSVSAFVRLAALAAVEAVRTGEVEAWRLKAEVE